MKTLHYSIIVILILMFIPISNVSGLTNPFKPEYYATIDKFDYNNTEHPSIFVSGKPNTSLDIKIRDNLGQQKFADVIKVGPNGTVKYSLDITSYKPGGYDALLGYGFDRIDLGFTVGIRHSSAMMLLHALKDTYFPGEYITIFGASQPNAIMQLSLMDPSSTAIQSIRTISDGKTGHFSSSDLKIPPTAISGRWWIVATSGENNVKVGINVNPLVSKLSNDAKTVEIHDLQVTPSIVKVGDAFAINATLVNNSPNPVFLTYSYCEAPFSVIFNSHVAFKGKNPACVEIPIIQKLNSGEKITITSPGSNVDYDATAPGITNATISFSYFVRNQTDSNSSNIGKTISKSFLFMISNESTSTTSILLSPLKQFKSGIAAKDVQCNDGFQRVIKSEDDHPACVKLSSVTRLLQQGWIFEPYVDWSKK